MTFFGGSIFLGEAYRHLADGPYILAFRAHHLRLARTSDEAIALKGTVAVSEISGSESYIHVEAPPHRFVVLVRGVHRYEPGAELTVYVEPRDLLIFDQRGARCDARANREAA